MSKDLRLPDYLDHMLAAAVQACSYVEDMDKATFLGDKRTQQAVIFNLVVIGEVASKLLQNCAPFLDLYPTVTRQPRFFGLTPGDIPRKFREQVIANTQLV